LNGTNPKEAVVDYEADFETKEFHGSLEIPVLVHASGHDQKKVMWDFRCDKEVKYSIEFFSENNNDSTEVAPKKKADAHRLIVGEWMLSGPGKIVLYLKSPPLSGQNSVKFKISVGSSEEQEHDHIEPPELKIPEMDDVVPEMKKTPSSRLTMNIQLSEDVFKAKLRVMEKKMDKLDDRFDELDNKLANLKSISWWIIIMLMVVFFGQVGVILHEHRDTVKLMISKYKQ
jgi:hypothetical protein